MRIYTLGYQQINLQDYLNTLVESGVGVVLDVREVAWSYKPGFSKSQFQKALRTECLRRYRRYLQAHLNCIDELLAHIRRAAKEGRPACLTCYERKPVDCHRSILIDALEIAEPALRTIHLEVVDAKKAGLQLSLGTRVLR
jgi:uncharacterized protein (DUF488 family)